MTAGNKKVTIKSIAEELGVSFSTVSKALNDDPLVNDATKKLVQAKAKELNYKPNYFAKGLRNMHTKTIGIILNDLENPVYINMIKKISIDLSKYDFTTLICDSQFDTQIEKRNILSVLSRMPDSIIISPVSNNSDNLLLLKDVIDKTIILDNKTDSAKASYIFINHERSGYLSAMHLLSNGHKKNLVLTAPEDFPGSALYINGIKQAYKEFDVEFNDNLVFYTVPSMNAGYKIVLDCINKHHGEQLTNFSGVLAFCDAMAFGVYSAAKKAGLKIPDDLSVIGYDDNAIDAFSDPPLTTIHMPKERIASLCSELLVKRLVKGEERVNAISLEPHLVDRGSVKKYEV